MVKPIDITRTVIVPKPRVKQEKLGSFFIGHVDQIVEPMTTEIEVDTKRTLKATIDELVKIHKNCPE